MHYVIDLSNVLKILYDSYGPYEDSRLALICNLLHESFRVIAGKSLARVITRTRDYGLNKTITDKFCHCNL